MTNEKTAIEKSVMPIFAAYVEDDLIDDRREYTVEDLQKSEEITHEQAVALFNMIQAACYGDAAQKA